MRRPMKFDLPEVLEMQYIVVMKCHELSFVVAEIAGQPIGV